MTKVNLDTIKPWVTRHITELLGFEDDVVIEFIFNQLDERVIIVILCDLVSTLHLWLSGCGFEFQSDRYLVITTLRVTVCGQVNHLSM